MEALDDLINERGFKQGQSVKLNYNDIVELVNQRVMENINFYLEIGWWIQVSPLAEKDILCIILVVEPFINRDK